VRAIDTGFFVNGGDQFSFGIKNTTDGSTILSTEGQPFLLMQQHLEVGFKLGTRHIFGLGEQVREGLLR